MHISNVKFDDVAASFLDVQAMSILPATSFDDKENQGIFWNRARMDMKIAYADYSGSTKLR
jgi:hypothetical protein